MLLYIFLYVFLLLVSLFPVIFMLSFFFGPPFIPTPGKIAKEMITLAKIKKGATVVDLGSGDGRLLIEAALHGATAIGYEINPFLALWTKLSAFHHGVSKHVSVKTGNYNKADLKKADIIFVYGITGVMDRLQKKIFQEAKKGTLILSYKFPFPHVKNEKQTPSGIFTYRIS